MFFVTTPRSSVLLVGALLLVLPRPPFGRSIDSFAVLFVAAPRSSLLLVEALLLVLPPPFGRSIDSFSEPSRSLELLDERVEVDEEEAEAALEVLAPSLVFATSHSRCPHRFIPRAFAVSGIT